MELKETIKRQSEANFSLLLRYYQRGTIVPFIGSGFSANISGNKFPQWRKFLLDYAGQLGIQKIIIDILEDINIPFRYELAATTIAEHDAAFTEKIQDFFVLDDTDTLDPYALVQWLPKIFPKSPLLTSNLDTVIETVYQDQGLPIDQIIYGMSFTDQQLKRITSNRDHVLLKVHGCVKDKDTVVFSENQYSKLYGPLDSNREYKNKASKKFPAQFKKMTNEIRFLFLGCSLSEDRYIEILRQVKEHVKEDANYHFAIIAAPEDENEFIERQQYLASCGIAPIWYAAGHYEQIGTYLSRLFSEVHINDSTSKRNTYINGSEVSHFFVDSIAQIAHDNNTDRNLAKAILVQSKEFMPTTKVPQSIIMRLCKEVMGENEIVPEYYELQGRHYMAVMDVDRVFFCCLYGNTEEEVIIREVKRDASIEAEMIYLEQEFWMENVCKQILPPYMEDGDLVMDSVRKYGERADENAPSVTLDITLASALAQYMQLQEQKSRCDAESRKIESSMKRLRGQIVSVMGSSCKAVCQRDGQDYTVTYNPVRRLDVSKDNLLRLQLNHPEIYDEYVTVSEHRRFYVKTKEATAA